MRPTYENAADLEREQVAIDRYVELTQPRNIQVEKLHAHMGADFLLLRDGRAREVVEIKTRPKNAFGDYDTVLLPVTKRIQCQRLAQSMHCNWRYVMHWLACDTLSVWTETHCGYQVEVTGRTDRNDPKDHQPMFHIPLSEFEVLR